MLKFTTKDHQIVEVRREVALFSVLIKNLLEDVSDAQMGIPIPVDVDAYVLRKIFTFCEYHCDHPGLLDQKQKKIESIFSVMTLQEECALDDDFTRAFALSVVRYDTLENILARNAIMNAAFYLDIPQLSSLLARTFALCLAGKSVEEMRAVIGVTNDITPEEEREIEAKNRKVTDSPV